MIQPYNSLCLLSRSLAVTKYSSVWLNHLQKSENNLQGFLWHNFSSTIFWAISSHAYTDTNSTKSFFFPSSKPITKPYPKNKGCFISEFANNFQSQQKYARGYAISGIKNTHCNLPGTLRVENFRITTFLM